MTSNVHLRRLLPGLVIGALVVAILLAVNALQASKRTGEALAARLETLNNLRDQYTTLNDRLQNRARKILPASQESGGVVGVAERIFDGLGLRERIVGIKPGERNRLATGDQSESARIEVRKLDLNGLVNLLFHLEQYRGALQISDLRVKTDFENPELLNVDIELILVTGTS